MEKGEGRKREKRESALKNFFNTEYIYIKDAHTVHVCPLITKGCFPVSWPFYSTVGRIKEVVL